MKIDKSIPIPPRDIKSADIKAALLAMAVGDSFFVEEPDPRRSEIRRNLYNISRRLPVLISTRKWTLNGKEGFRVWKTGKVGELKPTLRPSLPTLRFLASTIDK